MLPQGQIGCRRCSCQTPEKVGGKVGKVYELQIFKTMRKTKICRRFSKGFLVLFQKNQSVAGIAFLLFLSFLNRYFEILKWQQLVSSLQKISFKKSMEQCLGSLTLSLLTPNRIGEYGAKALYFKSAFRKRVLFINLISNLLQMLVTVVFGIIGILLLSQSQNLHIFSFKLF